MPASASVPSDPSGLPLTDRGPARGAPCWVNLLARDLRATQEFYGAVLGWSFRPGSLGEEFPSPCWRGSRWSASVHWRRSCRARWRGRRTSLSPMPTRPRPGSVRGATVGVGPLKFGPGRAALARTAIGRSPDCGRAVPCPGRSVEGRLRHTWSCVPGTRSMPPSSTARSWAGASGEPGACHVDYEHDQVVVRDGPRMVATLRRRRCRSRARSACPAPLEHVHPGRGRRRRERRSSGSRRNCDPADAGLRHCRRASCHPRPGRRPVHRHTRCCFPARPAGPCPVTGRAAARQTRPTTPERTEAAHHVDGNRRCPSVHRGRHRHRRHPAVQCCGPSFRRRLEFHPRIPLTGTSCGDAWSPKLPGCCYPCPAGLASAWGLKASRASADARLRRSGVDRRGRTRRPAQTARWWPPESASGFPCARPASGAADAAPPASSCHRIGSLVLDILRSRHRLGRFPSADRVVFVALPGWCWMVGAVGVQCRVGCSSPRRAAASSPVAAARAGLPPGAVRALGRGARSPEPAGRAPAARGAHYDDKTVTDARKLDIDHVVPLAEAWDSGASKWTAAAPRAVTPTTSAPTAASSPSAWAPTAPRATRTRPSGCRRPRTPPAPTSPTGSPPNSAGP